MDSLTITKAKSLILEFCNAYSNQDLETLSRIFSNKASMWSACSEHAHNGFQEIEKEFLLNWNGAESRTLEVIA
ncbi:MAG: hypothetical protein JSS34_00380 [Proteobacteria bacterium]|nr:hypothetical protein [Pseudomonadota bacterium]